MQTLAKDLMGLTRLAMGDHHSFDLSAPVRICAPTGPSPLGCWEMLMYEMPFLPLRGRLGRHGIYLCNSAIGIDTGYDVHSPLTCLSLPDFNLYQAFADGSTVTNQITTLIPESLREMQRKAADG